MAAGSATGRIVGAGRMRQLRRRRRAGDRWIRGFDVSREVLKRLFEEGWTTEKEARDPQRLSDVVADFLDCWARETPLDGAKIVTPLHEST